MKRYRLTVALAVLGMATLLGSPLTAGENRNFVTAMSGADEVPARDSHGRGVAIFHVSEDGTEIAYKLIVANIENVVAAHIHVGAVGVNGPVVVGLFSGAAGGGRTDGPIAEGVFTAADLTGPLAGLTLSDLLDEMEAGNAYVNVHTNDGIAPTNTGPGDFPGGEIRGQIK